MVAVSAPVETTSSGFRLNTGRIRDQWHTMTRTGKTARLARHQGEPFLELHPADALELGINSADLVSVTAAGQSNVLRAIVGATVQKGTVFAPMHWTRQNTLAGWVNANMQCGVDPVSGQPVLKNGRVIIHKFNANWYGFLASKSPINAIGDYSAVVKRETGWQAELAGENSFENVKTLMREFVKTPYEATLTIEDKATGLARYAWVSGGKVDHILCLGPAPVRLSRLQVIKQIGQAHTGIAVLAGIPSADRPDPGATVCACMCVGINTLQSAIANGATNVETLLSCTGAGTVCGACRPELAKLVLRANQPMAAE